MSRKEEASDLCHELGQSQGIVAVTTRIVPESEGLRLDPSGHISHGQVLGDVLVFFDIVLGSPFEVSKDSRGVDVPLESRTGAGLVLDDGGDLGL